MAGQGKKPDDPVLEIVIFPIDRVNDKNENEPIDKNRRELHVILGTPQDSDGCDDDEGQEEKELIERVDDGGGELVDSEE